MFKIIFSISFLITTYPITMDNLTWYLCIMYHLMYKYSVNIPKYLSYKAGWYTFYFSNQIPPWRVVLIRGIKRISVFSSWWKNLIKYLLTLYHILPHERLFCIIGQKMRVEIPSNRWKLVFSYFYMLFRLSSLSPMNKTEDTILETARL